jgi:hypothetical protein
VQTGEEAVDDPPGDDLDSTEGGEARGVEEVSARGASGLHARRER